MALVDVDDTVLPVQGFHQDCEVVVLGEVPAFDVELVEPIVMSNMLLPDLFDVSIIQLLLPVMMVHLYFFGVQTPVSHHFGSHCNHLETHPIIINKSITYSHLNSIQQLINITKYYSSPCSQTSRRPVCC